jgi:hypothetical protein
VLGLVALLAQQSACLETGLEIDSKSERGRVGKGEAETVERLGRRFGLGVPDRRQQIAQGMLIDILDRAIPDFGYDMDVERGQPAPGRAIAFELGLTRFETARDRLGDRQARDHPVLLAASLDRALPGAQGGAASAAAALASAMETSGQDPRPISRRRP